MMDELHRELIAAIVALPERELVEVLCSAFERRTAELAMPEEEEARLCLVEAHRFRAHDGVPAPWDLLVLARPREPGTFVTEGIGPTEEGTCCGVTLAAFAKRIVCPLCGKPASAT